MFCVYRMNLSLRTTGSESRGSPEWVKSWGNVRYWLGHSHVTNTRASDPWSKWQSSLLVCVDIDNACRNYPHHYSTRGSQPEDCTLQGVLLLRSAKPLLDLLHTTDLASLFICKDLSSFWMLRFLQQRAEDVLPLSFLHSLIGLVRS